MDRRTIAAGWVLVAVCAGAALWSVLPAQASCAGPIVSVHPTTAAPGARISVEGSGYADRCNDVIICHVYTPSPSPSGSETPTPAPTQSCETPPAMKPLKGLSVRLIEGDRSWSLGSIEVDPDFTFVLTTHVPSDAMLGAARIQVVGDACGAPPDACASTSFRLGLANSGFEWTWIVVLAGGALAIGAALRLLYRRSTA